MAITLAGLPGLGDAITQQPVSASPESLRAQRDYAKALMTGAVGKGGPQFPVVQSWTQGVSNMANALMGGLDYRSADAREQAARDAAIAPPDVPVPGAPTPPGTAPPTKGSFNDGPSSGGREKHADAADDDSDGSAAPISTLTGDKARSAEAIASIESADWKNKPGGQYAALGPQVLHGSYAGDRAYGKYQVMGNNVGPWTKEVLGQSLTPQEFLNNPQAQDAVFAAKFTTPRNWFGHGFSDGYMKGTDYEKHYANAMGRSGGQAAPAAAFAGPDDSAAAVPAVQAMANALKGGSANGVAPVDGPQVAQNGVQPVASRTPIRPNNTPQPNGSGIYIDPKLIKPPPQYTPERMNGIMNLPESVMSAQDKAAIYQQYRSQGQPIDIPVTGGHVRVDPYNPTNQQFIPDLNKGTKKIGDIETPYFGTVTPGPNGTVQENPSTRAPPMPIGPQSQAAPPAAPAAAPVAPPQAAPVLASAPGPAAPVAPPSPPAGSLPPGVQVASNNPAEAFAEGTPKAPLSPVEQQMMAMAGKDQPMSGLGPAGATPPAGIIPAVATESKPEATPVVEPAPKKKTGPLAQAFDSSKPPPGVSQEDWDTYTQKKAYDKGVDLKQKSGEANIEVDKDARIANNKLNAKRYTDTMDATSAAIKAKHNLDLASAMMSDKNFYSGFGSGIVENVKRLSAALGIDENAAKPMEVFRKTMASAIANGLKSAYGGLGQIRNKEIELQEKANGSLATSPAANKVLIEVSRRNATEMANVGEIANEYRLGGEIIDPTDPTGKKVLAEANIGPDGQQHERVGLDPGYDKLVREYLTSHPTFSPQEFKDFNETIDNASKEGEGGKKGAAAPVSVTNDEDYAKVPKGAQYTSPDGKTRTKQ